MARAEMVGRYGSEAYTEGYKVITTVRSDLQNAASQSVRDGLIDYDQRHGYRGPETRLPGQTRDAWLKHLGQQRSIGGLEPAIVTQVEKSGIMVMTRDGKEEAVTWDSMKWARPFLSNNSMGSMPRQPADVAQAGDQIRVQRQEDGTLRFVQIPAAQSALISLDPKDGAIRSLVGGFSFEQSNYNRAIQAKRQPGSSFKPFIYSAALDNGFTAASLVNDAPIVFVDEYLDKVWRPKNDTNTFLGPIPLREAPVQVPQHGLDPRPAGPGHRAGDQLHHQVRLPARRTAAQLLPGPGYRDSHTDGNRRRLERIRQRRLQGQSVRHRTHREPRRTGAVPGQSAPRAGGRTGRCAGCGRRRESW